MQRAIRFTKLRKTMFDFLNRNKIEHTRSFYANSYVFKISQSLWQRNDVANWIFRSGNYASFLHGRTWLNQCIIKKTAPTGLPECRESPEDFSTLLFLYGETHLLKQKSI
ncbi:hypothetical protein ACTP13_20345 [Paenibacillus peoriae]